MRIALAALTTTLAASACGQDIHLTDFQPDPPTVYVAKVKNILVGLPPTADEIAAVQKDPKALSGLVDQWMAMPEYDAKMQVFFELSFQQTQITAADFIDLIPQQGLGIGRDVNPLVQNIRESFARTAVQMASNGQPFTDAFTTHQLMMTPAMMELYAFLDSRQVDDNGNINDVWEKAAPTQTVTVQSTTPIAISDSLTPGNQNFLNFYNPDLPNAKNYPDALCDGMTSFPAIIQPTGNTNNFTLSYTVHDILYGTIPLHRSANGPACTSSSTCAAGEACTAGFCTATCTERTTVSDMGVMIQPSDFTTWKMVTIRTPDATHPVSQFYNLPALRNANELVLATPRVGFFTTPAFMANWPTNASNAARVTTNQALIVATGTAIDGTDGTNPGANPPGLDPMHAAPGSSCFGCHQLLDPTRSIFTATYSYYYYPQTDAKLMAVPGLFAFQGVVAPMKTIDDFASQLANHPLVPQAWAQKLCYYVNSAPCDPADPEFQRIVAAFAKDLAWNSLVKDLATSPITTNTAPTQTQQINGEVIAVSRRDHLCAALNNRLGFVDICQLDATLASSKNPSVVAQIVSGLPSDGYGRGSTIPVLPNDPTLFYRAGLENICEQVAMQVIDAKPNPLQPGVKIWSSSDPTGAINDFVSTVMALVPSDPRAPLVTTELTNHFTAAQAQGASATAALQSTFVAACLSPSFIGIGM